jgi:hypothetical protein
MPSITRAAELIAIALRVVWARMFYLRVNGSQLSIGCAVR